MAKTPINVEDVSSCPGTAAVLVLLMAATVAGGAPAATELDARLNPFPPCAALVTTAQLKQIPLETIDPWGKAGEFRTGDSVTALVTLFEKGDRRTQWLLYLEAVEPTAKEKSAKSSSMIMYSCTGNKFEFVSSSAPVMLRTLGPFDASATRGKESKPQDNSARIALDKGLLSLGLDSAATAMQRQRKGGEFTYGQSPFTEAQIRKYRESAAYLKLTEQEERAFVGTLPALISYFTIVQQTKGLNDILFKFVDKPSAWSVLRHGVNAAFSIGPADPPQSDAAIWGLPGGTPVDHLAAELHLNGRHVLDLTFAVTSPRPPLLTCGGIAGFLAEKPGDKQTYMTLRVISARQAAARTNSPSVRVK